MDDSVTVKHINIARDFAKRPGGRYEEHGPHSGEEFREKLLLPALRDCDQVVVYLDGTQGLPPSFLEEAFGGSVRALGWSPDAVWTRLRFVTDERTYLLSDIREYVFGAGGA